MSQTILDQGKSCNEDMNSQSKKKYIEIFIPLNRPLTLKEYGIVDSIQKKFKKNGFYFDITDAALIFNLNSMDVEAFKEHTLFIIPENDTPEINKDIFFELITRIDGIKSYGIKGRRRLYVDYNKERKVQNRAAKIAKRSSHYYSLNNNFSKVTNELPEEFTNKILCGDSEAILKNLPDNCVDLVFTSPPYNFGLGYDISEDGIHWDTYFDKLFAIFKECIRVVKYGGRIIVNVQPLFSDYIPSHHIISNFFMQNKMIWKGEILWEKNNYNCKYTAWGSWKSPSSPYLKYTWEFVEVFCKGDLLKSGMEENIDILADEFKKWVLAKWAIAPERNMQSYGHPAMFPEELVERVLKLFSYQNDVILDPFNGVGTTTVVAKKLNRKYLGIDVSEEYCKKSELRIKEVLQSYISL